MMIDTAKWRPKWIIEKYASEEAYTQGECYERSEFEGNLLLNEGIAEMWDLVIGAGGTAYNNANTYIGVGDSSTAESASQTGLQASTNKTFRPMEASFPSRVNQTVSWKASFGSSDANYAWNEFTVVNASSDTGKNLNRKVSAQGTKTSGQVWTITIQITLS